ncbi:hypothetical protein B566_EDAN009461, partial [Ephemera danica]
MGKAVFILMVLCTFAATQQIAAKVISEDRPRALESDNNSTVQEAKPAPPDNSFGNKFWPPPPPPHPHPHIFNKCCAGSVMKMKECCKIPSLISDEENYYCTKYPYGMINPSKLVGNKDEEKKGKRDAGNEKD